MVPPKEFLFDGTTPDGFLSDGKWLLGQLIELADLQPQNDVLDVGSGLGRLAVPLTGYLAPEAHYEGFDVVRWATKWCTDKITSRHPNFRFRHIDVRNDAYAPEEGRPAEEFRFPYGDASFDVVVLHSVFTHMMQPGVENYMGEIARVLRPGGRSVVSYFLLNEASMGNIRAGRSHFQFAHGTPPAYWEIADSPEQVVGYEEGYLLGLYTKCGLKIEAPIRHGTWSEHPDVRGNHQDFIVATRLRGRDSNPQPTD